MKTLKLLSHVSLDCLEESGDITGAKPPRATSFNQFQEKCSLGKNGFGEDLHEETGSVPEE